MVTICTYNARTLASESLIEDLLMQARRIRYDIIVMTDYTYSTPSMTSQMNCSSENATVEESTASAFSSARVCLWTSITRITSNLNQESTS
ncbi:unnamed protein product [Angiostrongylus costaricensis]|uniref:Uncharacterized protein n=1 Tax=Angiostrongylus costaricensis TaxID=334426 RepID=A0A0R3PD14_ANGCS|nr:unnamed protein product [Angiostrongylus costaricensis]